MANENTTKQKQFTLLAKVFNKAFVSYQQNVRVQNIKKVFTTKGRSYFHYYSNLDSEFSFQVLKDSNCT